MPVNAVLPWFTPTCRISQSRIFATNTALFLSGGEGVLVDPGITPAELEAIHRVTAEPPLTLRALILTHAHWDHLLGPAHFPGIAVLAHRTYSKVVNAHLQHLRQQVARWQAAEKLDIATGFIPPRPDYTFEGEVVLSFGDDRLRILASRGHAPDHCVIYEPRTGVLFAGDMLSDIEVPMVMDTFAAYRHTLRRLAALDVRALVPAHGTPTTDPVEISGRFTQDLAYLDAVSTCAAQAVAGSASLEETVSACRSISFRQPDSYPHAHRWNIEQAYLEAGGQVADTEKPVAWEQDWL